MKWASAASSWAAGALGENTRRMLNWKCCRCRAPAAAKGDTGALRGVKLFDSRHSAGSNPQPALRRSSGDGVKMRAFADEFRGAGLSVDSVHTPFGRTKPPSLTVNDGKLMGGNLQNRILS
ncbi:hypothetical protein SRABI26_00343 [Arthrobacter sp. Bi26]|nr:hypothetical protein SRABI26_00343 [Arthrobacter sp. Bi26]